MLKEKQLGQAEQKRIVHRLQLAEGQTIDQLLDPQFWAHVAKNISRHDIIEVLTSDYTEYAELFVIQAEQLFTKVRILSRIELTDAVDEDTDEYYVEHRGKGKWCVMSAKDKAKVRGGFDLKEDAIAAKEQYMADKAA